MYRNTKYIDFIEQLQEADRIEELEANKDNGKLYTYEVVCSTEDKDEVKSTFTSKYADLMQDPHSDRVPVSLGSNEYLRLAEKVETDEDVKEVPGTMKPQQEPEVETPDDMEDIEKEDLSNLDITKKKDRKDVMKEVPDKDLEVKPLESKKSVKGLVYLCDNCCKTFESETPVCTFCKSDKVEQITEQDVLFYRHVYEVWFKNPDGTEDSTRVTAYDKEDAASYLKRIKPNVTEIVKVELIAESYKKRGKRDGTGPHKDSAQRSIHGDKGVRKIKGEKCPVKEDTLITPEEDSKREAIVSEFENNLNILISDTIKEMKDVMGDGWELRGPGFRASLETSLKDYSENVRTFEGKVPLDKDSEEIKMKKLIEGNVKVGDVVRVEDLEDNLIVPASKVTFVKDDIWRDDTYQVITTENGGDTEYHGADHLFIKESKLIEAVGELIDEVPGIDEDQRTVLHWALENGFLDDKFPSHEDMISELEAMDVKFPEAATKMEVTSTYLQDVLVPKAEEAYTQYVTNENKSKVDEDISRKEALLRRKKRLEKEKADFEKAHQRKLDQLEKELKFVEGDAAKESKVDKMTEEEAIDILGNRAAWELRNMKKALEMLSILNTPEDEKRLEAAKVLLKSRSSKRESKLKEQDKDSYTTVAKGIENKDTADKLAAEKKGMVIKDEEDDTKFTVIVKESKEIDKILEGSEMDFSGLSDEQLIVGWKALLKVADSNSTFPDFGSTAAAFMNEIKVRGLDDKAVVKEE